jgi:hypothetical protein
MLPPAERVIIEDWLTTYISRPHPDLGRPGAVCPYVPAARRYNLVVVLGRAWEERTHAPDTAAETFIRDAVDAYASWRWPESHPGLRSVIAVSRSMPRRTWRLLDTAQSRLKSEMAERGLMIGTFHLDSTMPAAHNQGFAPSTAPYPLVAVRAISQHDLWFLHRSADHFAAYRQWFAHRFTDPAERSQLGLLYRDALERYGDCRHMS